MGGLAVAFLAGPRWPRSPPGTRSTARRRAAHTQRPPGTGAGGAAPPPSPRPGTAIRRPVPASWTAPDGRRRTGAVPAPPVARPGGAVMVWVDAAGRLTEPPLQPSQVRGQAMLAATLRRRCPWLILLCAGQLAHRPAGPAAAGRLGRRVAGNRAAVDQAALSARHQPGGTGTILPSTPVVVLLDRPAGHAAACMSARRLVNGNAEVELPRFEVKALLTCLTA